MDQASSLRELMNQTQQVFNTPVAVLSTSDFEMNTEIMKQLSMSFSSKFQRKMMVVAKEENEENLLEKCINENKQVELVLDLLTPFSLYVKGDFSFLETIRNDKKKLQTFLLELKKMEKQSQFLLYYAGSGLNSTAVNLSLSSTQLVVCLKPTSKSFTELENYIKIFKKTNATNQIGIVMDVPTEKQFQEQFNNLQEFYWKQFKYYIEPIGFFDSKNMNSKEKVAFFNDFNYQTLLNPREGKTFSTKIEELFL